MKTWLMLALILMHGIVSADGLGIRVTAHKFKKANKNKKGELKVTGVIVQEAAEDSPIKTGDVIVDVDGKTKINSGDDLKKWESGASPEKTYKVNLFRRDEKGNWLKRAVSVKITADK